MTSTRPDSPAVAREHPLPAPISGRFSILFVAVVVLAAVVAGLVLVKGEAWFQYSVLSRPGYVRVLPEGESSGPPPMSALFVYKRRGEKVFERCQICHQPDGMGDGVNYPPLGGSEWATGPTERMAMIILNGLRGPDSTGKFWSDPVGMIPQSIGMSAEDLAAVMTYVRNSFGNETGDVVSVAQARRAMEISASRLASGTQMTAEELEDHEKELEGDPIAPDQPVDPVSLEPVGRFR
jgi:mono/diheme cytochrome c family protein